MYITVLTLLTFSSAINAYVFITGCPDFCICDLIASGLTIKCHQTNTQFRLPEINQLSELKNVSYLSIKNSFLINYPPNICQFSDNLKYFDLSYNLIDDNLNGTNFDCLTKLEFLYLSNNLIKTIDENSFNKLESLKVLDLSHNRIESIPSYLFYFKLPELVELNLRYNLITELDVWMAFLKSIKKIDLSYNKIEKFINKIGWSAYYISPYTQLTNAEIIDLRFNNIKNFDDSVLRTYSLCSPEEFSYFLILFNRVLFDQNPLVCNCQNSFNLLKFYDYYIKNNLISSVNSIFLARCASPNAYLKENVFKFTDYNICENISTPFNQENCYRVSPLPISTSTSPNTFVQQNLINQEQKVLQEKLDEGVYDSQIAGIVIGLIGILFLFLILLYCICPIEILAICFNCIPFFYSVCPCKSGVRRDKEYDLFISYNRSNEKWVRNVLVKFIQEKYLIKNYILHYNEENKLDEIFGSYIKDIMNRSSCILFVLSDQFLLNEWSNQEFVNHLRHLITREKTRFICIQMHDICDEEVKEYFTDKLQIPRFISLENDEFLFWKKLAYFLYTNDSDRNKITPINYRPYRKESPEPQNTVYCVEVPKKDNIHIISDIPSKKFLLEESRPPTPKTVYCDFSETKNLEIKQELVKPKKKVIFRNEPPESIKSFIPLIVDYSYKVDQKPYENFTNESINYPE